MSFSKITFSLLRIYSLIMLVCMVMSTAYAQDESATNPVINVATYNLRLNIAQDEDNAWPHRREAVQSLIRYHEFDIFGTQEGLKEQIAYLALMKEYKHVGVGRDDGKSGGEFSAIFFRDNRFSLEDNGDFWLSQTPEQPSKGWDARCCNRIVTWVKLRDLKNNKSFFVFSVHFDHEGVIARRESAKLLLRKIAEIAENNPVICVGDFNSTPETEQILTMQSALRDAYLVTSNAPYGPVGTFNGFKLDAKMADRIDYIFVNNQVEVIKYAVLSDSFNQHYPSDHHPVVVKINLR